MKNFKIIALFCLVTLLGFCSGSVLAAERIQYWAKDASSEFDAVKAAYKQILGQAIKLQVGSTSGSIDAALQHQLNRKIEEEFVKTKQQFIQSSAEDCDSSNRLVNCLVVAGVKMDEVSAWLRRNMGDSGSNGKRLKNVKFGIMANTGDEKNTPHLVQLVKRLHKNLGHKFGNDIYKITPYIDPNKLRNQCVEIEKNYKKRTDMGAAYATSATLYKQQYEHCMTIVDADLDAILVIKALGVNVKPYDGSKVEGSFEPDMLFIQTRTKRELYAPDAKMIVKTVYGSKMSAEADFNDEIYQATIHYISQQFNDIVITAASDSGGKALASGSSTFDYIVTVTGVNTDDLEGKKKLRFLRKWFKNTLAVDLKRDVQRSSYSEKVNSISSTKALDLFLMEEDLPLDLDEAGYAARIDVNKDGNIIIAFKGEETSSADKTVISLNDKKLTKWLVINQVDMLLRREDSAGTPIALYEAVVNVSNSYKRDVLVEVKPAWTDAQGLRQTIPFSDDKQFLLKAKSSATLVYRAPNRQASHVSLEFTCPAGRCDIK